MRQRRTRLFGEGKLKLLVQTDFSVKAYPGLPILQHVPIFGFYYALRLPVGSLYFWS